MDASELMKNRKNLKAGRRLLTPKQRHEAGMAIPWRLQAGVPHCDNDARFSGRWRIDRSIEAIALQKPLPLHFDANHGLADRGRVLPPSGEASQMPHNGRPGRSAHVRYFSPTTWGEIEQLQDLENGRFGINEQIAEQDRRSLRGGVPLPKRG